MFLRSMAIPLRAMATPLASRMPLERPFVRPYVRFHVDIRRNGRRLSPHGHPSPPDPSRPPGQSSALRRDRPSTRRNAPGHTREGHAVAAEPPGPTAKEACPPSHKLTVVAGFHVAAYCAPPPPTSSATAAAAAIKPQRVVAAAFFARAADRSAPVPRRRRGAGALGVRCHVGGAHVVVERAQRGDDLA